MDIHLSSMENISCWAFRKLCLGASDSYTGMLSLSNLVNRKNTWDEIDTFPIEGVRQWIQISTSKEKECISFLKKLEDEIKKYPQKDNIYGIQLNFSCPSPNLIRIGQGPALIKRATKVCNLVKELLKQNKYRVGLKLRLGLNEQEVKQGKIFTLLKELEKIAKDNILFSNVTIHLKHAYESSSSPYNYDVLNEIASFHLPFIINGGIKTSQDIDLMFKGVTEENKKNIKGIMVGRESLKNQDCIAQLNYELKEEKYVKRSRQEIEEEFHKLCSIHMPKEIYLKTIKQRCTLLN